MTKEQKMELRDYPTCELYRELLAREAILELPIGYNIPFEVFIDGKKQELPIDSGPCGILVNWD